MNNEDGTNNANSQDDPAQGILGLTNEQILSFLESVGKNHVCPYCTSEKWTLIRDEDLVLAVLGLKKDGTFPAPPTNVPVALVGCDVCGYLRHHALGVIKRWIDKNPG
ncbi:hypothetical protein CURE108131_23065 [Cupriavidus respiraculi]|uniref:Uncharacterized protein n=1 Tax=Cupriavidus respiraculi TaxID=195930 RepID=A0ABM8WY36_9BURK|nr:hypothetical protein [Cupriavidus respiraculi]CAG9172462.1 hypothetical protein LMG21510_01982 [Cupriavidus respiraculi]